MLERRRIVDLAQSGSAQVLITLVRAEGSSYRRPGARLLLATDHVYAGTISGGCLEAEVTRKATWLIRHGARVERYSTLFDDTSEIPFGLGCGGVVDLLFEPVDTPEAAALLRALEYSLSGVESEVITWLPENGLPLRRAVVDSDGKHLFTSCALSEYEVSEARITSSKTVYREHLESPQRLVLLGAGDDAKPVATIAGLLGWNVVVADGRAQLARADRFPEAESVRVLQEARDCAHAVDITPQDAVVLMTHSYEQDRDCLAAVLAAPPQRYLGILGARHRTALLVAEAAGLLGQSLAACCQRIHAPIGLDLGGDGPEAIALAIVSEIQACLHGKLPASRRLTENEVRSQLRCDPVNHYHPISCAFSAAEEAVL